MKSNFLAISVLSWGLASAGTVTLGAVNSGFYDAKGGSTSGNYAAGWFVGTTSIELRDYFVFDLSTISGTITAATLHITTNQYISVDPNETFSVFDVATALGTLTAGSGGVAAFTDLGSGTSFGSIVVPNSAPAFVDVALNANGLAFLQANSGQVGLGGALTSLAKGGSTEALFNASSATLVRQLVITTTTSGVPEPSAILLCSFGILALGAKKIFPRTTPTRS
jgi:hypothetical protein